MELSNRNKSKEQGDTVEEFADVSNNNNNNQSDGWISTHIDELSDQDAFLTDEGMWPHGTKSAVDHMFDSYPQMRKYRNSYVFAGTALLCIVVVFIYLFMHVLPLNFLFHEKEKATEKQAAPDYAPINMTNVINFSTEQLSGISSGRLNQWAFEMKDTNREAMEKNGFKCATPWLSDALAFHNSKHASASVKTYYNLLNVLASNGTMLTFYNVHDMDIHEQAGSTLVASTSIRFSNNKKARHYFNELKFAYVTNEHNEALTYTSKSKSEAFCIQELYAGLLGL